LKYDRKGNFGYFKMKLPYSKLYMAYPYSKLYMAYPFKTKMQ